MINPIDPARIPVAEKSTRGTAVALFASRLGGPVRLIRVLRQEGATPEWFKYDDFEAGNPVERAVRAYSEFNGQGEPADWEYASAGSRMRIDGKVVANVRF